MSSIKHKLAFGFGIALGSGALIAADALAPREALAQNCASFNPSDWPAPAKPYFLLMVDTSGSMTANVGSNTSCTVTNGMTTTNYGSNRRAHARCAVRNTLLAYSGQVNFGLATFATVMSGCSNFANGLCDYDDDINGSGCDYFTFTGDAVGAAGCGGVAGTTGCGPEPSPNGDSSTRQGSNIVVPILQDIGSPASNVANLLAWVDGGCADNRELYAAGCTPLNGMLRDAHQYYSNNWNPPDPQPGGATLNSPLTSVALGERGCRSLNVILITDGDETCDSQANAVDAAQDLYAGFTKDGITWRVRTHVINFAGGSTTNTNQIADAGDDGLANGSATSYQANNESQLALAKSDIISSTIKPETCNNVDDNCNNCVDEGYVHYCNDAQACCGWNNATQRQACLDSYATSVNADPPDGDLTLLPCATSTQAMNSSQWLCVNPGDECDNVDNNCSAGIDEGSNKCGSPAHCPLTETCNGQDDDCDGTPDDGGVCVGCTPSAEVCDGCDNDCDGVADDGIPTVPCGLTTPANCVGVLACNPPVAVSPAGSCAPGGGYGTCSNNPQTETCDGIDNDCDGIPDDGVPPAL